MEVECSFYIPVIILISGAIKAIKDCWLIGDSFLQDVYKTFMDMKTDAKDGKCPMPYLYEYYNISYFVENPLSGKYNTLSNLSNSIVRGLNTKTKAEVDYQLPRFIIMLPEDDILKFINFFMYGVSTITGRCLNWLINEVDRSIEARNDELRRKRAGTVTPNEPKFIWITMMDRPNISYNDMLACRGKYNGILENLLANKQNHFILDISKEIVHPANFFRNKRINTRGKLALWKEIDKNLEDFDYRRKSAVRKPEPTDSHSQILQGHAIPVQKSQAKTRRSSRSHRAALQ